MRPNHIIALLSAIACLAIPGLNVAQAQCPALPYQLQNGQALDAPQVMANFNSPVNCINDKGSVGNGTAGQVGVYGASGSAISGQSLSSVLDQALGATQGSIFYRSASGWAALGPGIMGYVLQSGGASGNPSWVAPGAGGGINTIVGAGVSSTGTTVALPAIPVISRPSLASFTWVNQASATAADNANGPLVLRTTQNTGGSSINALVKSVAGSDWTVTVQYALGNQTAGTGDVSGFVVHNSVNGRLYVCGLGGTGGSIDILAYNNPTSWNSYSASKGIIGNPGTIWTRAKYVSSTTTLTFSYSIDGFTWETILTTSTPFTGVATGYGMALGTQRNNNGYILSLNYMAETSP